MRGLLLSDFKDFVEGEREDKIYWLTNYLEQRYQFEGQLTKKITEDIIRLAMIMGMEVKIFDDNEVLISDTDKAYLNSDELIRKRLVSYYKKIKEQAKEEYNSYPLYSGGEEIGTMEVRYAHLSPKSNLFLERSNSFFFVAIVIAFIGTVFFSFMLYRTILIPVEILYKATQKISYGDNKIRLEKVSNDELGHLFDAFNGMLERLKKMEEARKISVAKFAHELRTPLTIIQGELEGMMDGVLEMNNERISSIIEELTRLKKMVFELEALYRLEKKTKGMEKKDLNIKNLLENIKRHFDNYLEKNKNLEFIIECPKDLVVRFDEDLLKQLLLNLISNSINATKEGYIKVSVYISDRKLNIIVEDTGKGIDNKDLPFIFDPFYGKSEGLGIGLAIVREIVEILNGNIELESKTNLGTKFTILLPIES